MVLGQGILHASLSGTLLPNSAIIGDATEGAHLIFAYLSVEIALINTALSVLVPGVKFVEYLSTKTVQATCGSRHVNRGASAQN